MKVKGQHLSLATKRLGSVASLVETQHKSKKEQLPKKREQLSSFNVTREKEQAMNEGREDNPTNAKL